MQAIVLALALAAQAPASSDSDVTVPARFVGDWAGGPASCGSEADDLVLRLTSHHISYWESAGPIRPAVVRGDEIALVAELSGEGETWLSTIKFELSPDGRMLIDRVSVPGKEVVRYRCSGSIGARHDSSFKPNPLRGSA
jgi:hypothetical protein